MQLVSETRDDFDLVEKHLVKALRIYFDIATRLVNLIE